MKPNTAEEARLKATLEKTEHATDADALFLRTETFICLGRNKEALECIQKNASILEKDLERLFPLHIELLLAFQDYDGALEAVKHYADLPYFNQAVEEMIREYPKKIREIEKKRYQKSTLDIASIKANLTSKNAAHVLLGLQDAAYLGYLPFLKEILSVLSSDLNDFVRTFALLVLVDGKYMEEVNFTKNGIDFTVVPENLDPPYEGYLFTEFMDALRTHGEDPSVVSIAEEIFRQYVMALYPEDVLGTCDELLTEALFVLAHKYLAMEIDLNAVSQKSGFPVAKIEALAQIIDEMTQKSAKVEL